MTFLQQLLRRAFITMMIAFVTLFLLAAYYAYASLLNPRSVDTYSPSVRVKQYVAVSEALLDANDRKFSNLSGSMLDICTARQVSLLLDRMRRVSPALDSVGQIKELIRVFSAMNEIRPASCGEFLTAVDRVVRLIQAKSYFGLRASIDQLIRESLTEDVDWSRVLPCLYVQAGGSVAYFRGPSSICRQDDQIIASESRQSLKRLADIAYQKYSEQKSPRGGGSDRPRAVFGLNPDVQRILNSYINCYKSAASCDDFGGKLFTSLDSVALVVTNPADNELLGVLCLGPRCERNQLRQFDQYVALMLEVPMASTAKIFYALAFATDGGVSQREIEFQIKTSGQLDSVSLKRNEWWEKTAICDGSRQSGCSRAYRAQEVAELFGWNQGCFPMGNQCGRVQVMPGEVRRFASLGRFITSPENYRTTDGMRYIPWTNYEAVRQDKTPARTFDARAYSNTSYAVQSVIGAGDSRVSAFGLATMSSNIYRLARGEPPRVPQLISELNDSQRRGKQAAFLKFQKPARVVMAGMTRAMTPAEVGWLGDGTGHRAFLEAFGRRCEDDCPVAGKTGTISSKDKNFAGTTLFSGIANLRQLRGEPSGPAGLPDVISVGVIVFPRDPGGTQSGHLASKFAMHALRSIASVQ